MNDDFRFTAIRPGQALSEFVENFWMLHNQSDRARTIVVVPDGRVELTFSRSAGGPVRAVRSGIETRPVQVTLQARTQIFSVSLKLPAPEYIFDRCLSGLLNNAENLPSGFWGMKEADLQHVDAFCTKASHMLLKDLPAEPDRRKQKLFGLLYATNGSRSVHEISEAVHWASRQINRYFRQQYGLSLKAYSTILRFRSSLEALARGMPFSQLDFTDQSHFIREIRKFSGVAPRVLLKNENDRFIQFSALIPR